MNNKAQSIIKRKKIIKISFKNDFATKEEDIKVFILFLDKITSLFIRKIY